MIAPLFKKNTLEQTGFSVSDDGFSYRGRSYRLADVVETRSYRVIHQTRHIPLGVTESHDPAFTFVLVMRDGEAVQVTEQSTLLSSSKQERVDQLQATYDFICENTFDQRARKYVVQVEANGFFDYGKWRLAPSQQKFIHVATGKGYSVADLQFIRDYGFIEIVPANEGLVAQALRKSKQEVTGKRLGIGTLSDGDVFYALLSHYFHIKW